MKKTLSIIISLLLVICMASCNVIITNNETTNTDTDADSSSAEESQGDETETEYPHADMELAPLEEIIATTENQSIPVSTFKYFFMDYYSSFISQYYYVLSYYNFDESIPLHDQQYTLEEGDKTWYDVFLENGKSRFEQYVKFTEMAIKEGMTLSDDDYAKIKENLDSIEKAAAEYSQTFEEYMSQFMGEGMTRERVEEATKITQLGYNYYTKIYNSFKYTDEQIENAYNTAGGKYSLVDYNEATIKALYDETDSDEQVESAKNAVKEKAEKMKELIDGGMSFADAYNTVNPSQTTETDTEADGTKEKPVNFLNTAAEYSEDDIYAFLYENGTKEGQVDITYDENGNAYIIQCVKLPYKNTNNTVNVRHILLSSSDYSTEEEAYAMAEKLLKQINEAADKKAEFISLVPEYSSDTGSKSNDGLYENVLPGKMITEFNDWCFDSERQPGDTGIVQTDYGYHVMYFDGYGSQIWSYKCEEDLRTNDFSAAAQAIYNSVKITYNEDLLDRITK